MGGEVFKGEIEGGVHYIALYRVPSIPVLLGGPLGQITISPGVDGAYGGYVSGLFWSLVVGHIL